MGIFSTLGRVTIGCFAFHYTMALGDFVFLSWRRLVGPLCDWARPRNYMLGLYVIVTLLNALSVSILPVTENMEGLAFACAVFGYTNGASITLIPILIESFVEPKDIAKTLSLIFTLSSPASLVGTPIAGMITQACGGSYTPAFLISAALLALSNIFVVFIAYIPREPALMRANTSRFFAWKRQHLHFRKNLSRDPSASSKAPSESEESWHAEHSLNSLATSSRHSGESKRLVPSGQDEDEHDEQEIQGRSPLLTQECEIQAGSPNHPAVASE
eukprot:m.159854 g.159854  ORF g.159854 m.159854 type:complete len:273 (-) comp53024_c0_seq12:143-961(-)